MIEDISPEEVFAVLEQDPAAQLVDVRTDAEWQYVGLPDLRGIGKQIVLVSWQYFPTGNVNQGFVAELLEAGLTPEHKLYFICRSGVRSRAAANVAQAAGFTHSFNVADGFEGCPDQEGHRGMVGGWKACALPWRN